MVRQTHHKLIVYTDGGSRGNPGPAGIGVVIANGQGQTIKKYSQDIGEKTNNEAEYEAVIFALQKIRHLFGKQKTKDLELEIRMDSELVARQLAGKYKIIEEKLFPLFIKIWNLRMDFGKIEFIEISREKNREADRLANEAMDEKISKIKSQNAKLF
ncbi:ribonuclease HI family protein [Patescibacteria group bacterium]|nr:ribonuclease HI family protein [Patescibacteria group bacterium]MBU2263630.1 ribonuclease HI family protein [Patescibacteria group bacterium]